MFVSDRLEEQCGGYDIEERVIVEVLQHSLASLSIHILLLRLIPIRGIFDVVPFGQLFKELTMVLWFYPDAEVVLTIMKKQKPTLSFVMYGNTALLLT